MVKIVYIHVPKCGGSTFSAALRLRYLVSQGVIPLGLGTEGLTGEPRILADYAARDLALRAFVEAGKELIIGHVRYPAELHDGAASSYRFVTLLRDPVERFVSHYNYLERRHPCAARPKTLEGFLETEDAARIASQYLFYFAGVSQTRAADLDAAIQQAIRNLGRFALVGDLSAPEVFARDLRGLTGARLLPWRRNTAPKPTQIPALLRPRIEALTAADLQIYRATKRQQVAA